MQLSIRHDRGFFFQHINSVEVNMLWGQLSRNDRNQRDAVSGQADKSEKEPLYFQHKMVEF